MKVDIKKYNFIILIIGLIFSIVVTFSFFPKIENGAISINISKDFAFLLYYSSLLILYGLTFWNSTIKRLDYNLKIEFIDYKDVNLIFLLCGTVSPMLNLIFGTFDSFGTTLAPIIWIMAMIYILLYVFYKENLIYKKIGKYLVLLLEAIFIVVSFILFKYKNFIFLAIIYIIGSLFYLFSFLLRYNILNLKNKEYYIPLLLLVGSFIIYLGNLLILFNAY